MSKTVTFVIKQLQAKKLKVADGTTVRRLRGLVADMGYDVLGDDTRVRIVRDGSAIIGHIKDEPLRRNDIVVFESDAIRLQISPEVADTYRAPAPVASPCDPDCCEHRVETIKQTILEAIQNLATAVANA